MKRTATILWIITLTLLISETTYSQRYRKKEVALISFKLNINSDYQSKLDPFSGYFNEPNNKNVNRIENQILYTAWDIISEKLRNDVGMILLPIDAYGNKFNYDSYGFPDVGINKAMNKGQSKYYIKIDIEFGPEFSSKYVTISQPDTAKQIVHLKDDEIKPKLVINMTIYSDKGIIPVANCTGEVIADQIIILDKSFFDGFINDNITSDNVNLYGLMQKATKKLINSVYYNK